MSIDEEDVTTGDSQLLRDKENLEGSQNQNAKKEGSVFIQFGTFPE